jgi:integrase
MIYKRGKYWHIEFEFQGVRYQRSARTENRREAESRERAMRSDVERGVYKLPPKKKAIADRLRVRDLLQRLEQNYNMRGKGNTDNLRLFRFLSEAPIADCFADALTDQHITEFIAQLQRQGFRNSTVNNRVQLIRQAYKLAKVPAPQIPRLSTQGNARQGFLLRPQFDLLYARLPAYLQDFALFLYVVGWRSGAVKRLEWGDVQGNEIQLRAELSKNRKAYRICMNRELAELIERRRQERAIATPQGAAICRYIFHRNGKPLGNFREAWVAACAAAGCPGTIPHDMRRSAVRNLVRAKVPRSIAKKWTGHESDTVFERYNIIEGDDMQEAAELLEQYTQGTRAKVVSIK